MIRPEVVSQVRKEAAARMDNAACMICDEYLVLAETYRAANQPDAIERAEHLQRFKDRVHNYLDEKGVPHHPPGTHGAEGCRIGDRMDYVFDVMFAANSPEDENAT